MTDIEKNNLYRKLKDDIEALREPVYGYIRAGFPNFPALFGRDSCIISWQLGDYDHAIQFDTLRALANLQGRETNNEREEEPGKIIHEWHPNPAEYKKLSWPMPYYGSVDSTALFIFLCRLYYDKSGDKTWLQAIWPNIVRGLEWCETYGDPDRDMFLEYERKNPEGLIHQGWKDSNLLVSPPIKAIEAQGYYYLALHSAADMAEALGKSEMRDAWRARAASLKQAFFEKFWLVDREMFVFAFDGKGNPDMRIMSNPGHLLFTGILDGEKEKTDLLVRQLFAPDMWTSFGIRTHSTANNDFDHMDYHRGSIWPHDNWIIAQGLRRMGYLEEYAKVKNALYDAQKQLGKIPELFAVTREGELREIPEACSPQGWATGALMNFIVEDRKLAEIKPLPAV